jgi:hypothetical protein
MMTITSPPIYLPGDKVYYSGEKFKERLNGKPGWIHAPVLGSTEKFVVEFPDTRNPKDPEDTDDYVMHVRVLTDRRPPASEKDHGKDKDGKKSEGPEIQPRRRKKTSEEE